MSFSPSRQRGFTLIEVVVVTFIIGTVVAGIFGLFLMTLRGAQTGERRVVAIALANERAEMVRNLPYVNVGTVGGIPSGAIPQEETIARNGQDYVVRTDIRYVDDDYDGEVGGNEEGEERITICHKPGTPAEQTLEVTASSLDAHLAHGDTTGACGSQGEGTPAGDEYNADYKQVRIEVLWPNREQASPVLLITYVAPQGIEGGDLGGTLDFHAFDADGDAVVGATMVLTNNDVDPPISVSTQTNAEGRVVLPGLPEASDSYHLSVTKSGYTTEQTYDPTATFAPLPEYSPFSLLVKQVTQKTYYIDQTATLAVSTVDEAAAAVPTIAYTLRGTKTIGQDATSNPVRKVDEAAQTNAVGLHTHTGLDWDTYDITIDGAAEGFDIKEASSVLPLSINPGQAATLTITLVPHTDHSLQVTVVDSAGNPVDNATVALEGVPDPLVTGAVGQVFFGDLTPAAGQELDVSASGFVAQQQLVDIAGTQRIRLELEATP